MIATQEPQLPHGVGVGPSAQLRAFARTRAVLVFPVPRGPVKRYAWATLSSVMAFDNVVETVDWPRISSKVWGRYLR